MQHLMMIIISSNDSDSFTIKKNNNNKLDLSLDNNKLDNNVFTIITSG